MQFSMYDSVFSGSCEIKDFYIAIAMLNVKTHRFAVSASACALKKGYHIKYSIQDFNGEILFLIVSYFSLNQ